MRKVVYVCDRCGQEITQNPMLVLIDFAKRESNDRRGVQPVPEEIRRDMQRTLGRDYCYECTRAIASQAMGNAADDPKFSAMMEENQRLQQEIDSLMQQIADAKRDQLAAQAESEAKKLKKRPERREKKELDIGKAEALSRAGWDVEQIAADMGFKTEEVEKALRK